MVRPVQRGVRRVVEYPMATASRAASDPLAVPAWVADGDVESKSERYLAKRLAAAGADFKGVALTTFLLAAGVGVMLWLAFGVIVEHWLMPGGLPAWVRWAWLAAGLVVLAAAVVRWVVPLLRYRVNLVYAARMLEQEHPELHNDVVNAVLAQAHADETTPLVVKSLRRRAARQLAGVSGDGAVDRGPALKLAYALAALIAAACIYELLAPKSLVVSATRLVAPWLGVAAPSRVRIAPPMLSWTVPGGPEVADRGRTLTVVDGVATLVRGRQVVVSSDITGLAGDEKPELLVTPVADDASAAPSGGWRAAMLPAAAGRFTAVLPDAMRGLDQSVDIVIAAGDARSERFRVAVVDEPAMLVRELHYRYPPHTGQADETIPWQGDVRGVEGTHVTVVAECNHPLEAAWIDLGPDGKRDAPMSIDPKDLARGRGTFTLRLSPDRSAAEHSSYRLLFQPKAASLSQREPAMVDKMQYRIEVLPDLAPEIAIEEPAEKVVRVPPDAPVTVRLRAVDPDFGLASVTVETRLAAGAERPGQELLVGARKTFRGAATLIPAALGAGPGQVLEYRGVAKDTRPEAPNVAITEWYALTIDPSAPARQPPPAPRDDTESNENNGSDGEPQAGDAPPDQQGESGGGASDSEGDQGSDSGKGKNSATGKQGEAGGDASAKKDDGGGASESQDGKKGGPKGDGGNKDGEQSPSQRQSDPKQAEKQGEPQEGEQQGSAEGGKQNDANEGKAGKQPGQQQQKGSQDGAGSEPEGQGGSQQQGGKAGSRPDGGPGAQQRPSGGGAQGEGKPGSTKPGGDSSTTGPQSGEQSGGAENDGKPGSKGDRPSERGDGEGKGQGKPGTKETVASDGTDDGEAMERILEHRRQTQKGESAETGGEREGREAAEGQQTSSEPKNGSQGNEPRDPRSGQPPGPDAGQKPESSEGAGESVEQKSLTEGEGKPGEGKPGEGKPGEGKPGEGKPGEGKPGEGKPGEGKPGEGKPGEGKPGEGKPGEGKPGEGKPGEGKPGEGKPGEGKPGEGKPGEGGEREVQQSDGNDPGGATVGGGAIGGDRGSASGDQQAERQDREMEWGEQDLAHARNAADLAMEHLKNAVDSGDAGMLDELGWTPEQARAFLARWEAMRRMARSGDPRARGEFDQAVKSLGLRPTGVRSSRDVPADTKGGQAEGRRSRPPSDYREQFKAFMQGTSAE